MASEARTSEALVAFMENYAIFEEKEPNPEKHNLYKGLMHLSVMVEDLLKKMDDLQKEIATLKKKLS